MNASNDTIPEAWTRHGVVPAKLILPSSERPRVERPRIAAALDQASARSLAVLVAPAGSGKTTALASWARARPGRVAWLALDRRDQDPSVLLRHLLAALALARPGVEWTDPPRSADPTELHGWLIDRVVLPLAREREPLVLVLDDVHALGPDATLLEHLLADRPPALHLVLAGRALPKLTELRRDFAGEVAKLDARLLDFDIDDLAQLVELDERLVLDSPAQLALLERSGGWAAGVGALALAGVGSSLERHDLEQRALEFLADQVVAVQSPERRELLLACSVLDEVCPSLAAALHGRARAGEELLAMASEGLLVDVIASASDQVWLRFHPLFLEALRQLTQRSGIDRAALHRRACAWFVDRDRMTQALEHAVLADDPGLALALVEQHGWALLRRGQLGSLARLLELCTGELSAGSRALVELLRAWTCMQRSPAQADAALTRASEAIAALEPHDPALRLLGGSLRSLAVFLDVRSGRLGLARSRALELLAALGPGPGDPARGLAVALHLSVSVASELLDDAAIALEHGGHALALCRVEPALATLARAGARQVGLLRRQARLRAAERTADELGLALDHHGWTQDAGELQLERARIDRARGQLERAEATCMVALEQLRRGDDLGAIASAAIELAGIRRERADLAGASDAASEATRLAWAIGAPWLARLAELERLEPRDMFVLEGDPPGVVMQELLRPATLYARARAAARLPGLGEPAKVELVAALENEIERLEAASWRLDAIRLRIELAALTGQPEPLAPSIELARVEAIAGVEPNVREAEPEPGLLSARELEVLAALAKGASNQVIARGLFISLATVKTHVHNILGKLDASNRTAAVHRGVELGLIGR